MQQLGYVIIKGKCIQNCTYSSNSSNPTLLYCVNCISIAYCKKCNATTCLECPNQLILYDNKCNSFCPIIGYYKYQSGTKALCGQCHKTCQTCISSQNTGCLSCNKEYQKDTTNKYCIEKFCMQYQYMENFTCYPCNERCLACDGPSNCIKCKARYIEYQINDTKNVICKECKEIRQGIYYNEDTKSCDGMIINRNLWRWNNLGLL